MNAFTISHLTKHYPDFSLEDVSLTLAQGSILGLVGANGAGKTTLIKLLMHTISADGGTVTVLGTDVTDPAFSRVKQEIGVVLDEAYFLALMTARAVDRMMAGTYPGWDSGYFWKLLDRFGLPEKKAFKDFSRGMKMKLSLATALAHRPKLLVLDEATGGLDPVVREEVLDLLRETAYTQNCAILLSSHIVTDLEKICDYIAFLRQGRLVLCREKDQLLRDYALLHLRRGDAQAVPEEAIVGRREDPYGVRLLVHRDQVSDVFPVEHTTLEDIILFLSKEGDR